METWDIAYKRWKFRRFVIGEEGFYDIYLDGNHIGYTHPDPKGFRVFRDGHIDLGIVTWEGDATRLLTKELWR